MSIIQKIQDKYGKVMAIIIGIALVIFVVMLAFENGGSLFKGQSMTVGKVNGETVEIGPFQQLVEQQTQQLEARGMGSGENVSQQANESAWDMEVTKILLEQEAGKLGLSIGKKELNDLLFGENPPQELRQGFTDPQTGRYDGAMAQQQINQIRTRGTAEQKAQINAFLDQLAFQKLAEKYDALMTGSINFPKWLVEKQNAENSLLSKVSFVRESYAEISDSAVKVTDGEIRDYINRHKKDFKQTESRSISYVAFTAQPSGQDSAQALEKLLSLRPAFDTAHDMQAFLVTQGINTYYNSYISQDRIQVPMKDSIFRVGAGQIYGPYIDAHTYALAKVMGVKSIPDTVNIRHILIGTSQPDPQSGQMVPIRDTASAKKLADSVALAIRNGANFDSMVVKFSNDPGSVNNHGVYENVPSGQMVPEFNDFIFGNPVGSKGVVKTSYGYHYVEILSQKGQSTGYKIAYLTRPIEASQETDTRASNEASQFAAQVTNAKTFDAAAEKLAKEKQLTKSVATDIPPMGSQIPGVGNSRSFVKNIYKGDLGDIVQPERVGDFYVVALITEINKEGTMSPAKARMMVEPLLVNDKKAELIKKKIGPVTTLEAAAKNLNKQIETADSVRFSGQSASVLGFEPKVIGAAFNKANLNKVVPEAIAGNQGVFVVKVDNVMSMPVQAVNVDEMRKMQSMQARQQSAFQSLQVLKEAAKIKDYRRKFY